MDLRIRLAVFVLSLIVSALATAQAAFAQSPPAITWRDGKTRLTFDNAHLEIGSKVQVRFTHEDPNERLAFPGTGGPGEARGSFRIRRAKFKIEGWLHEEWLTFELQVNYPGAGGPNAGALLEDATIGLDLTRGRGILRLQAGQFKPPMGLQEMSSSSSQMFVDRALVTGAFFRGRDVGVALWGGTPDHRLEWRVGMFNGNGTTRPANDNAAFQYNARLLWQPNGHVPLNQRGWTGGALYSESDFESTETPIYAVAVNLERQNAFNATSGNDLKWITWSADGVYKFRGLFVTGMYGVARRTPEVGPRFDSAGGFLQAGQLFGGRRFEVGVRYGHYDPSDLEPRTLTREVRGAFSYYFARHALKWQNDVGRVTVHDGPGPSIGTWELRSQLQFAF